MYKHLVTLFWHDVEFRMKMSGINDSGVVSESTRELLSIFYGLVFAYDEVGHNGVKLQPFIHSL